MLAIDQNLVSRRIDGDRSGRETIIDVFRTAATQNGFDPQNHFARTKRFRHVIVRAEFQSNNAIDLLRARRQHQDWNVARGCIALEQFANFESGHFRQHQIENDEVRLLRARFGQTGGTVGGRRNHEPAGLAQIQC